jgi:ribosomal peptide maturation radical SAM protein 1
LPLVDFSEYFSQFDHWLPVSSLRDMGEIRLAYESSRGCWWGQKHHCTFCGLNGNGMGYRQKTPEQVLSEITELAASTGIRRFGMTDNIMPLPYFTSLLPALAKADLSLDIFYEQKANISLDKVMALKAAGINGIQPGIESLQDDLLRLMKKGTTGRQNIALLRYARSVGVSTAWNILSGFPRDREEWYEEMLRLVPLITHLEPPTGVSKLNFDRFSPYFDRSADYGITDLRPLPSYREAFPHCDNLNDLAYHFIGDYDGHTIDNSETLRQLKAVVEDWRCLWDYRVEEKTTPCLEVVEIDPANYLLIDTRPLPDIPFMQQISADQASVALTFHTEEDALTRWGEQRRVCVKRPNGFIPLACAAPEVLGRFEKVRAPSLQDAAV